MPQRTKSILSIPVLLSALIFFFSAHTTPVFAASCTVNSIGDYICGSSATAGTSGLAAGGTTTGGGPTGGGTTSGLAAGGTTTGGTTTGGTTTGGTTTGGTTTGGTTTGGTTTGGTTTGGTTTGGTTTGGTTTGGTTTGGGGTSYPGSALLANLSPDNTATFASSNGTKITRLRNVSFATRDGYQSRYDLYLPPNFLELGLTEVVPVVFAIHSGGWQFGDKSEVAGMAMELAAKGYMVISPTYRFSPAHPAPAAEHDIIDIVEHVKKNHALFKIDPNRVGTTGVSAGGHLAMLASVKDAPASGRVKCVANIVGPGDLTVPLASLVPYARELILTHVNQNTGLLPSISPKNWLQSGNKVKYYSLYSINDPLITPNLIEPFHDAASSLGISNSKKALTIVEHNLYANYLVARKYKEIIDFFAGCL